MRVLIRWGIGLRQVAMNAKELTGSKLTLIMIMKLYNIVKINHINITRTIPLSHLGWGLDLMTAMINHSCEPNVVVTFSDKRFRARALRLIRAGEELLLTAQLQFHHVMDVMRNYLNETRASDR
ncbi:hypothetical protein PT974_08738 [Cladobotryum mycophilum]|uniref:SET domain-containing protein n=1 Tax=Cladobotryum mycophilum TaxID=491253 RepID=A0ABR0SFC5_9HYPO